MEGIRNGTEAIDRGERERDPDVSRLLVHLIPMGDSLMIAADQPEGDLGGSRRAYTDIAASSRVRAGKGTVCASGAFRRRQDDVPTASILRIALRKPCFG